MSEKCIWCAGKGNDLVTVHLEEIQTKFSTIKNMDAQVHQKHKAKLFAYYDRLTKWYQYTNVILILTAMLIVVDLVFGLIRHPLANDIGIFLLFLLGAGLVLFPFVVPGKKRLFGIRVLWGFYKAIGVILLSLGFYILFF